MVNNGIFEAKEIGDLQIRTDTKEKKQAYPRKLELTESFNDRSS